MERLDTNEKNERKKAMKILWLAAGLMAWTAGCGGKTKPGAPTAVKAVAGNGQATVSWTPPAGKLAVQSYLVTINYYVRSQHADLLSVPSQSSAVIPNLTNGTSYTFNVQAVDSSGTGPASDPSNAVVPAGTPDKPTQVSAVAGNGLAVVTFTAPALTGGVALISYEVTSSPEYRKATVKGNLATSAVVPGLTNGVSYTFTVVAANPVASGAPSDASNPVTPEASLSAPAIVLPSTLSNPTIPKGFTGKFMVTNHMLIQGGLPPLQSPPYDRWDEFYFVDCGLWEHPPPGENYAATTALPSGYIGPGGRKIIETYPTSNWYNKLCRLNYGGADGNVQIPGNSYVDVKYYFYQFIFFCPQSVKWANGAYVSVGPLSIGSMSPQCSPEPHYP